MSIVNSSKGNGEVGITKATHFIIDEQHGNLSFDLGGNLHNLAKPSNDGLGVVYGTGHSNVNIILGENGKLIVGYANSGRTTLDSPTPDTNNLTTVTSYTQETTWVGTSIIHGLGLWTVEDNVGFRIICKRHSDGVVLASTCSDTVWNGGVASDYGVIAFTKANEYSLARMASDWPVRDGTLIDITLEFKSPVTVVGYGTHGVDWHYGWQDDLTPHTVAAAVYYDVWAAKTYAVNDKIVEDGTIYRANTAGAQITSFAANVALWTEVGDIPDVMTYKGGITVAAFNALSVGVSGDFYRLTDSGTLTGGVVGTLGDSVVLNTTISNPIAAGEFDLFPDITPNLQQAYDSSVAGRIITTTDEGSLKVRRGSLSDIDSVIEVENGAGTPTFSVSGEGGIVASSNMTDNVATLTKMLQINSSPSNGGNVVIAHGLDSTKIVSMTAVMALDGGVIVPRDSGLPNSEFFVSANATNVLIDNVNSSGSAVANKPVTIIITYTL